jgi:hypothetical protein
VMVPMLAVLRCVAPSSSTAARPKSEILATCRRHVTTIGRHVENN